MSGEIQNAQEQIREGVIPKAQELIDTEHHMVGLSRTVANHMLSAKKGILDHVLPHLLEAAAVKADLNRTGVHMTTQPEDVKTAAHAILGDAPLYTEIIEPHMTKTQKDTARASLEVYGPLYDITESALEALKILEESIGEASDAAFKRADDITSNDLVSTHATITALEDFNL